MGKRKHKDSQEYIKSKIRKLEDRLRRGRCRSSDSDNSHTNTGWSPAYAHYERDSPASIELSESEVSTRRYIQSVVNVVNVPDETPLLATIAAEPVPSQAATAPSTSVVEPTPSTSQQNTNALTTDNAVPSNTSLPVDILELLGEAKGKPEIFGPRIQEDVSKRWGRILCEGLNKEQKKILTEKILVPENFQLVKAPKLNPEIAAVLNETVKNRDKRLEKTQNYLGLGISALTNLICSLIEKNVDKTDIIKRLFETNQILLDLHFENTLNRRKLITYTLDKKFLDIVQDVKRDSHLFGENLTDKIKTSKSAEKSGLQIKKNNATDASTSKKTSHQQGNWRGPPRQTQRGSRQGGARGRQSYQSTRRPPPATVTDRYRYPTKTHQKPQTKTQ